MGMWLAFVSDKRLVVFVRVFLFFVGIVGGLCVFWKHVGIKELLSFGLAIGWLMEVRIGVKHVTYFGNHKSQSCRRFVKSQF